MSSPPSEDVGNCGPPFTEDTFNEHAQAKCSCIKNWLEYRYKQEAQHLREQALVAEQKRHEYFEPIQKKNKILYEEITPEDTTEEDPSEDTDDWPDNEDEKTTDEETTDEETTDEETTDEETTDKKGMDGERRTTPSAGEC